MTDYATLTRQAEALLEAEPWAIAAFSNLSALLMQTMPDLNWAGFYLVRHGGLTVGPFQGKPACIHIPFGKGVCGTAAAEDRTQLVPDVHQFPGHIACDDASASEMVIPKDTVSKIWERRGAVCATPEDTFKTDIPKSILCYKLKIIKLASKDTLSKLKDKTLPLEEQMQIIQNCKQLKEVEMLLSKNLKRIII